MVGEGGDWNSSSTTIPTSRLLSHRGWKFWYQGPYFAPRLSVHWLIQAIHSIPTLPMCHYKYNERLEKVEIGIHPPQPSPHSGFWVAGGENFSSRPVPTFHTKIEHVQTDLAISHQLDLPISHYKYKGWLDMVEIAIWALLWHNIFGKALANRISNCY